MRLLDYTLIVPLTVGTMDRYFNLMFLQVFPNSITSGGRINAPELGRMPRQRLVEIMNKLTKEHPVRWDMVIQSMGKEYKVTAEGGETYVRLNENGVS